MPSSGLLSIHMKGILFLRRTWGTVLFGLLVGWKWTGNLLATEDSREEYIRLRRNINQSRLYYKYNTYLVDGMKAQKSGRQTNDDECTAIQQIFNIEIATWNLTETTSWLLVGKGLSPFVLQIKKSQQDVLKEIHLYFKELFLVLDFIGPHYSWCLLSKRQTKEFEMTKKNLSTIDADGAAGQVSAEDHMISDGKYRNKQRCLVLCLRGATARYRHLLEDLRTLLPHHKKESKLDPGKHGIGRAVNDIAEMRSCNSVLFLECRKHQDAYLWVGRVGEKEGPSAKFHISNVHTMDELRLTGNCMKGSRPLLSFDESFQRIGHLKILKELFIDIFGTPRGHPKSKPFVDRVMAFYYADNKVSVESRRFIFEVLDYNIWWAYVRPSGVRKHHI